MGEGAPPISWEDEDTIEEKQKLKCPYCGEWIGVMVNKNVFTVRCGHCREKPIFEIHGVKPLKANVKLENGD